MGTCVPSVSTAPAPARTLDSKLAAFDQRADTAFDWLLGFIEANRDEILTVARARHVSGHRIYGDGKLYEFDRAQLASEILEECADAVVYSSVRLAL